MYYSLGLFIALKGLVLVTIDHFLILGGPKSNVVFAHVNATLPFISYYVIENRGSYISEL